MKKKRELCAVCGGRLLTKKIQYDQHWGEKIVVFEDVPAHVCLDCGEVWLSAQVLRAMDSILRREKMPPKKLSVPVWSLSRLKAA